MLRRLALALKGAPAVVAQCDANGGLTTAPVNRLSSNAALFAAAISGGAFLHMGFGSTLTLTPLTTGNVRVRFQGGLVNNTADAEIDCQFRYGSGAAPANGAAATGTVINGQQLAAWPPVANGQVPFSLEFEITGLTPGTAYWFDATCRTSGAPTGFAFLIGYRLEEF